jgi:hypothetical protein
MSYDRYTSGTSVRPCLLRLLQRYPYGLFITLVITPTLTFLMLMIPWVLAVWVSRCRAVNVHCNVTVVYAVVAPPIGEVVDSYDRRINTSNIAVSAYMVTNHSAIMVLLGDDDTVINHGVAILGVHHWTDMTTSTIGLDNYRHKAVVDSQLSQLIVASFSTSQVLGFPCPVDFGQPCPSLYGTSSAWAHYSHVLMACEADWGPPIIIDGECWLSRKIGNVIDGPRRVAAFNGAPTSTYGFHFKS